MSVKKLKALVINPIVYVPNMEVVLKRVDNEG